MKWLMMFAAVQICLCCSMEGTKLVWKAPSGDFETIEVKYSDTFLDILLEINSRLADDQESDEMNLESVLEEGFFLEDESLDSDWEISTKAPMRNFDKSLREKDKKDIIYIVTTLGSSSLPSIAKARSSLKKAGSRVDHVHPLRFLQLVFTSEPLKAAIHNMQGRSWVWSEFFDGLKEGLEEEANYNNLKEWQVKVFAEEVKIEFDMIYPLIQGRRWKEFINTLIEKIPRDPRAGRYNM